MQPQPTISQPTSTAQQLLLGLKSMLHFSYQIPLPQTASIFNYTPKHSTESKKKKKIKHKFDSFSYYRLDSTKAIVKILFVDDNSFIDQGEYPFTDPSGKQRPFAQISGKRLKITEAAYLGHVENNLIIKKMDGVKLSPDAVQVETIDENFELIKIGNPQRFTQFLKLMSLNKNAIQISIRVIIDETDPSQPEVIDFELFFREKQLIEKRKLSLTPLA